MAGLSEAETIEVLANDIAFGRALNNSLADTSGETFLFIAGSLLGIILLLAQGGGYVGGAAVAANAARLGRLPGFFSDDRVGIAVIWAFAAVLIPIIREVVVVEAYYAFGFVSAFVITSTTVFLVRDDALRERGIDPTSAEAKSLRFAGLRGMIASYTMLVVLVTQKTDALVAIAVAGVSITLFQVYIATRGQRREAALAARTFPAGTRNPDYQHGMERAHDEARQRGIADALHDLIQGGALAKFNVDSERVVRLVCHLHNLDPLLMQRNGEHHDAEERKEPSVALDATYQHAYRSKDKLLKEIERYSHYGIFTFINNYHLNWVEPAVGRDDVTVQQAMLDILFPLTGHDEIWREYRAFQPQQLPEPVWQFCRERYRWAKDQWPNLSDRITTIWTLQELGLLPKDMDVKTVVAVAGGKQFKIVKVHTKVADEKPEDKPSPAKGGKQGKQPPSTKG